MRTFTSGDSWATDKLLLSVKEGEVITTCHASKQPLFFTKEDGQMILLNPYGQCVGCNNLFSEASLKLTEGTDKAKYPVVYTGLWCKECWKTPLSQAELVDSIKAGG
jgi:hypothetical protein